MARHPSVAGMALRIRGDRSHRHRAYVTAQRRTAQLTRSHRPRRFCGRRRKHAEGAIAAWSLTAGGDVSRALVLAWRATVDDMPFGASDGSGGGTSRQRQWLAAAQTRASSHTMPPQPCFDRREPSRESATACSVEVGLARLKTHDRPMTLACLTAAPRSGNPVSAVTHCPGPPMTQRAARLVLRRGAVLRPGRGSGKGGRCLVFGDKILPPALRARAAPLHPRHALPGRMRS